MSLPVNVIAPVTKTDYVYQLIKNEIMDGKLAPGHRLRLGELASQYGFSEMPIREALRMLQRDGLVLFESHRGAMVVELSIKEIFDIIATRTYLEILAICEAAPYHDAQTLKRLDDLLTQMGTAHSGRKYGELNHAFHQALFGPCRNEFLKNEISDLWNRVWQRWSKSLFEFRPERRVEAGLEHAAIVEAIRGGSVDEVREAAWRHRERTLKSWQTIVQAFSESEGQEGG